MGQEVKPGETKGQSRESTSEEWELSDAFSRGDWNV